jgi:uncharacterized protein (TIGR00251 family)
VTEFTEVQGGVRFTVHVQPKARRTEIVGAHGTALKIRVQAPPVEGAANAAVVTFIADVLGVPRRNVEIVSGAGSRLKTVEVRGLSRLTVAQRLTDGKG